MPAGNCSWRREESGFPDAQPVLAQLEAGASEAACRIWGLMPNHESRQRFQIKSSTRAWQRDGPCTGGNTQGARLLAIKQKHRYDSAAGCYDGLQAGSTMSYQTQDGQVWAGIG